MDDTTFVCAQVDHSNKSEEELRNVIRNSLDSFLYSILLPIILIVGSFINIMFIYMVWKVREMRNHINYILVNLSIADFAFILSTCSWRFAATLSSPLDINTDNNVLGPFGCPVVILLNYLFLFASLFFVTFIAFERYYAVCFPLIHLRMVGKRRTLVMCTLVWLISFLFAMVILPSFSTFIVQCITWPPGERFHDFPHIVGKCDASSKSYQNVAFFLETIPFFCSLCFNLFVTVKITATLQRRVRHDNEGIEGHCRNRDSSRKQQISSNAASRMLLINNSLFFLCNAPYNILSTFFFIVALSGHQHPSYAFLNVMLSISRILLYINASVNPLVYGATNKTYRKSFVVICRSQHSSHSEIVQTSE